MEYLDETTGYWIRGSRETNSLASTAVSGAGFLKTTPAPQCLQRVCPRPSDRIHPSRAWAQTHTGHSCPQLLTQGKLFQQIKVTLEEVVLDRLVQHKGHAVPAELFVCFVPAWFKGQMCCFIGHDEDFFWESGQLLWLVFSGGPVLPRRQRQCHLNCGNVLSFYIGVCGRGRRQARGEWEMLALGTSSQLSLECRPLKQAGAGKWKKKIHQEIA